MKNRIILIALFSLITGTSCKTAKNAYSVDEMLSQAKFMPNYSRKSGFFMHSDTTKAVWIPRGRKKSVKIYERVCESFIYIP